MRNNKTHFMFRDRLEDGLLLAAKLKKYKNDPGLVLAVPRGWSAGGLCSGKRIEFFCRSDSHQKNRPSNA